MKQGPLEQWNTRPATSRARRVGVHGLIACALALCVAPTSAQTATQRTPLLLGQGGTIRRATPALPAAPAAQSTAPAAQKPTVPAAPKVLDPTLIARVATLLADAAGDGVTTAAAAASIEAASAALYSECAHLHGDLALLDAHLADVIAASDGARRTAAMRLSALLSWRHGDLARALTDFEALAKADGDDLAARLAEARLLDAQGRSKDALAAY
jgi:hypothetical protein